MAILKADIEPADPGSHAGPPWDVRVRVRLRNASTQVVPISPRAIASAPLVLEVRDAEGKAVELPPPPLPVADPQEGVPPGWQRVIEFENFLDGCTHSGQYRVRFRGARPGLGGTPGDPLESAWLDLQVQTPPVGVIPGYAAHDGLQSLTVTPASPRSIWDWLFPTRRKCWYALGGEFLYHRLQHITCEQATDTLCAQRAGCYRWCARFRLEIDLAQCRARIVLRIHYRAQAGWQPPYGWSLDAWMAQQALMIEGVWGAKFRLCFLPPHRCCRLGFPLAVKVELVPNTSSPGAIAGAHLHTVVGNQATWMNVWDVNQSGLIPHEIGHLLGPCDEYFTVACAATTLEALGPCSGLGSGVPYGSLQGGNIMHDASEAPVAAHLGWVARSAAVFLGMPCSVVPVALPCPILPTKVVVTASGRR